MYEVLIFTAIIIISLLIYKQQAASKKYNKLKRSIKTRNDSLTSEREKQKQLKAIEKARKEQQARKKKIIDKAYKEARKAVSDKDSILFKKVYDELLSDYIEEEEEKQKLYQSASDD